MPSQKHVPAREGAPMLSIRGLEVRRPASRGRPGYRLSVDGFDLVAGDRIGLVGESGAGKTTLLEMLGLLAWPDRIEAFDFASPKGQVDLAPLLRARQGDTVAAIRSASVGFVLQDGGLLPYLTVAQNAALARALAGRSPDPAGITATATAMGIGGMLGNRQSALSGGERQRAAVLRALCVDVPLLLADEPTASLDGPNAETVMSALCTMAGNRGTTLIVVSHDESLLHRFGFAIARIVVERSERAVRARLVLE